MHPIKDFSRELQKVSAAVGQRWERYPSNVLPIELHRCHTEASRNMQDTAEAGFAVAFAFWLEEMFPVGQDLCHELAISNSFARTYFMTQDALLDKGCGKRSAHMLVTSSLAYIHFIDFFRRTFVSDANNEDIEWYAQNCGWTVSI